MVHQYDARILPLRDRMAFWLDTVCNQILPVVIDPRSDSAPVAAMSCYQIGDMAIRSVVGGDHIYRRSTAEVRAGDPDTLQVGFPVGGSSILVQDGREALLSPGDLVLYDSSRPFTLVMEERFHWEVFLFPKSVLRRPADELVEITAIPLHGDAGLTGVVRRFLHGVARDAARLEQDPDTFLLSKHAADLTATLVHSAFGRHWDVHNPDAVLRERAKTFISLHHRNSDLRPATIARAHNVSVRRLHAAFEGTGRTVMDEIRGLRLELIRTDLRDARLRHLTIGQIAASHGYPGLTTFSRAFRAAYGVTPSEFRSDH